jgi:transposase
LDGRVDEDRLKRHDLTDDEWARLEPLLPGIRGRGTGGMITGW